jgi:hypothetical protein
MSDLSTMLPLLLARERNQADRLAALADLAGLVGDPAAVATLLELAGTEPDGAVRLIMLQTVAAVDITRLTGRDAHAAAWAEIAARETMPELRLLAVHRLDACGRSGVMGVADLLVGIVVHELDPDIRLAALQNLSGPLSEEAAGQLAAYAPRAAPGEDSLLLALTRTMPDQAGQRVLAALLTSSRPATLRSAALAELRTRTRLQPEALAALTAILAQQPDEESLRWAIAALSDASYVDPALLDLILMLATAMPERSGILSALRDRLDCVPDLAGRIEDTVAASPTSQLWLSAIALFAPTGRDRLPLLGLSSPSAATRAAALAWAEEAVLSRPEQVIAGLARQLPNEPLAHLRMRQAAILAAAAVIPSEAGQALVARLQTESIPSVRHDLCWALLRCQFEPGAVRLQLMAVLAIVLGEPATPPDLRRAISAHLQRVAAGTSGSDCVPALLAALEQADSLDEVEELDRLIRTLQPDASRHAALTHGLMRRYHHLFPRDPFTQWARDIAAAAKAGNLPSSAVIETVRLTGAAWLLEGINFAGDKDLLVNTIRTAINADRGLDAERAIREAYQQKTIRKRDLAEIVRLVAFRPRWHHLAQQALKICQTEKVMTPALVEAAWPVLLCDPNSSFAHTITEHFTEHAADPEIAARTRASCTPSAFLPWLLQDTDPDYHGKPWPIFVLLAACSPEAVANAFTAIPPHPRFHIALINSLRLRQRGVMSYWEHAQVMRAAALMWRSIAGQPALIQLRRSLAYLLTGNRPAHPRQHTGLEDRSRVWNDFVAKAGLQALEAPMPEIGAELWIDFCQQLSPAPGQPPAKLPPVPSGISLDHLRRQWPFPNMP